VRKVSSPGWAETTLTLGDKHVSIEASDVGPDSFQQVASCALVALQAHAGSQTAEFFEKPGGHIIEVRHRDGGDVERVPDKEVELLGNLLHDGKETDAS
jgi:hypothetical protein